MQPGWLKTRNAEFLSHWTKPFSDFSTSPTDFYTQVEAAFAKHEAPDAEVSRVTWKERSVISPERVYLRIERLKCVYDICAAPFGKDFFFSSWLVMLKPSFTFLHWIGMGTGLFLLTFLFTNMFGFFKGLFFLIVLMSFLWWLIRSGAMETPLEFEEFLLGLTVMGAIWEVYYRKPTYFEIDTALMFQNVAHAAVLEAVDAITDARGLPRLSDDERKPIHRDFFMR
ncbi:MAG: hypothetical protein GHCLOJNM_00212 [bacterium]|nr:hypothetical protein [bacterium]